MTISRSAIWAIPAILLAAGCFETREFADVPEDFDARVATFNEVSTLINSLPEASVPEVLRLAEHADPRVRRAAVLRLGQIRGDKDTITLAIIKRLDRDTDSRVRTAAVRMLGELRTPVGTRAVLNGLCDPDYNVQMYSWKSALKIGDSVYSAIFDSLKSDSPAARKPCNNGNGDNRTLQQELQTRLAGLDIRAVPFLTDALAGEDRGLRIAVINVLGTIGEGAAKALPGLADILFGDDEQLKAAAIVTMGKIGDKDPTVMPALYSASRDPSDKVSTLAIQTIRKLESNARRRAAHKPRPARGR